MITCKPQFVRVFDIQEDFAIVRLVNLSMAVVDDSGKVKHSLAGYKSVRIQENHIIAVTDKRNNEMYIDLYSGHLYTGKPKVVRLGDVQLLEVDGIYWSTRTMPRGGMTACACLPETTTHIIIIAGC